MHCSAPGIKNATSFRIESQGCQMVYFQTQNPNLGKFFRAVEWNRMVHSIPTHLEYITTIRYILWLFGNLVKIWYMHFLPFW
jgi:hypothetical protein